MQTLINWTKNPVVVVDENGDRITIRPGEGKPVAGNFEHHPWVKKRRLEITRTGGDGTDSTGENDELAELRQQYQNIFGKKPHGNASAETLRQQIEKWRDEQD
ncbi:hypothetical protein [Mangrovibacter phragmitis]|uniref:hypothetical protein n=1 Tax=Mangrovibacter phragmitis TaxID=1691903 RepID=UPI00351215BD